MTPLSYIHVHSMRLATGQEALVARVLTKDGKIGYGFSFRLDAAEARHMAEWHAGVRQERPRIEPALGHPWETAFAAGEAVPWKREPAFGQIAWLPEEEIPDMGQTISYKRPDGGSVNGYLAQPTGGPEAPGMVVIQEWWGLNDQIKGVADRLAAAGYRALVPDLYRGKVAVEANEAGHLMNGLDFADAAAQDVRGAVQHLKRSGSAKVGVTGFCMGGALTVLAAVHVPETDAAVIWYGFPPLEHVDAGRIRAPLMGHFALNDEPFPISGVEALEKKLRAANVSFDFYRYPAKHAFANETADEAKLPIVQYNPTAAELAWRRTLDFLEQRLRR